jgi:hypothetical protein
MITTANEDAILEGLDSKNLQFKYYGNGKATRTKKNQTEGQKIDKRVFVTYKYSQLGRGELKEAVLISDLPSFIKYKRETKEFELEEKIEEKNRILRPPEREEYPYLPYEFSSLEEINRYKDKILHENIDIDFLFQKSKDIISKFNNQDDYKINFVAADVILSNFQDRFSTIHYDYIVGGNGSGKSSLGDTFGAIAYRAVIMTDPTAPNLFRLLGPIEPAQCTMILEEAERIDKSPELMAILKTGYASNGRVPKINPNTLQQEFFFSYCHKVIISEKSLSQSIARGVNTRIIPINTFKGQTKYDIKEILNPTDTGGQQNKELLKELEEFRKLLLCYRLIHFKDPIPDLDIGVEGREKELVKHLIQLFYDSKCLDEIIESLQKFLDIKNQKKETSIDYALIKDNGPRMLFRTFWNTLKENIPGKEDEKKPNEYHTEDYGILYSTTITNLLSDVFGATTKHGRNGNMLIFDPEIIEKLSKKDKTKIIVKEISDFHGEEEDNETTEENMNDCEGVKAVNTPGTGLTEIINVEEKYPKTQKSLKEESNETRISSNKYHKVNSFLSLNENHFKEGYSNTPLSNAFTVLTPSQSGNSSIIVNQGEFNNPLISEPDLTTGTYDPKIINSICRFEGTDCWFCRNCNMKGDKWFMMKHPCNNNNNNNKNNINQK